MKKEEIIKDRFIKEFSIHFKDCPDELQFVLEFLREEIAQAKKQGLDEGFRKGYERGYKNCHKDYNLNTKEAMSEAIEKVRCTMCYKPLKPDKEAKNDATGKWDEHTYFPCSCQGKVYKNLRINIS